MMTGGLADAVDVRMLSTLLWENLAVVCRELIYGFLLRWLQEFVYRLPQQSGISSAGVNFPRAKMM